MKEIIYCFLNIIGCSIIWMVVLSYNKNIEILSKEYFRLFIIITTALVLVKLG